MPPQMPPQLGSAPLSQTTEEEKVISQNWASECSQCACSRGQREKSPSSSPNQNPKCFPVLRKRS